jgi:hypothetical protein
MDAGQTLHSPKETQPDINIQFIWNTYQYQTPLLFMLKKGDCMESGESRDEIKSITTRDQYRPADLTYC